MDQKCSSGSDLYSGGAGTTQKRLIIFTVIASCFLSVLMAEGAVRSIGVCCADWQPVLMFIHSQQGWVVVGSCPLRFWIKFPTCLYHWPSPYGAELCNWLTGQSRLFWRKPEQMCSGEWGWNNTIDYDLAAQCLNLWSMVMRQVCFVGNRSWHPRYSGCSYQDKGAMATSEGQYQL